MAATRAAVRGPRDRGAVTVEAALALCSLVVVLALSLGAVAAVTAQLRCIDAAREAARLTARGERERAEQVALRLAPSGAGVRIELRGDEVTVRVVADPVGGLLPGVDVRAEAFALLEPGVLPQPGAAPPPQVVPRQDAVLQPGGAP
jgi:hypothetical protein